MSFQVLLSNRFRLPGKKCRAQKNRHFFSVLFIAIQIKDRNLYGISQTIFVSVNLHMYKNSYVFASYLTLSIPDIVRSSQCYGQHACTTHDNLYNLFYSLISLLS